jgi:hypothetical protein
MSDELGEDEASDAYWRERWESHTLDFGSGVRGKFFTNKGSNEPAGVLVAHLHDGERFFDRFCEGAVFFDTPTNAEVKDRPKWKLVSLDPLHVEPSIRISGKGKGECLHGFIRSGSWTTA